MEFEQSPSRFQKIKLLLIGTGLGIAYGLSTRVLIELSRPNDFVVVMSFGFIILMPLAMGCIPVYYAELRQRQPLYTWALLPWVPVAGALLACIVTFLEGWICVVMLAPVALILATIGGIAGGAAARYVKRNSTRRAALACLAVFPFFSMFVEKPILYQSGVRTVHTQIDIHASPETIWKNIARVPAIRHDELPDSWMRRVGFPDPIEATLSHEGLGGVRQASYQGNLNFVETVDVWEPTQRLGFTLAADTDKIPATTLDEHVRVGGQYFDVLRADYRLEPLGNGMIKLHLSSQHRLSTDFNWYSHLWTEAILTELQSRILVVIKSRCENGQR